MPIASERAGGLNVSGVATLADGTAAPAATDFMKAFRDGFITVDDIHRRQVEGMKDVSNLTVDLKANELKKRSIENAAELQQPVQEIAKGQIELDKIKAQIDLVKAKGENLRLEAGEATKSNITDKTLAASSLTEDQTRITEQWGKLLASKPMPTTVDAAGKPVIDYAAASQDLQVEEEALRQDTLNVKAAGRTPAVPKSHVISEYDPVTKVTTQWQVTVDPITGEVNRVQLAASPDKDPTETDSDKKAHGYGDSLAQAEAILEGLEKGGFRAQDAGPQGLIGTANFHPALLGVIPEKFAKWAAGVSKEPVTAYVGARGVWAENLIRPRSGAVINDPEYKKVNHFYFPQLNDTAMVLGQKKARRLEAQRQLQTQGHLSGIHALVPGIDDFGKDGPPMDGVDKRPEGKAGAGATGVPVAPGAPAVPGAAAPAAAPAKKVYAKPAAGPAGMAEIAGYPSGTEFYDPRDPTGKKVLRKP